MYNPKSAFQQFNDEINEFHKYLKENKYTDEEIYKIFSPLQTKTVSKSAKIVAYSAVVLFVVYFLSHLEFISWNSSAIGRIFLLKLLPLWDWTVLKNEKCLIPKYSASTTTEIIFNCDLCENINHIDVYDDIKEETLKIRYTDIDVPVIINQPLKRWRDLNNFIKLLADDKIIAYSRPCSLSTNVINGLPTIKTLLERATLFENFFINFQNCDFQAMKQFRSFTPRPEFLPPEWSPVQYNWLLWSKNYNSTYKQINLTQRITVICQVIGEFLINLTPQSHCEQQCDDIHIKLKQEEVLIFTDLWNFEYKSDLTSESIAVILEMR